jgi:hypothetical protein
MERRDTKRVSGVIQQVDRRQMLSGFTLPVVLPFWSITPGAGPEPPSFTSNRTPIDGPLEAALESNSTGAEALDHSGNDVGHAVIMPHGTSGPGASRVDTLRLDLPLLAAICAVREA